MRAMKQWLPLETVGYAPVSSAADPEYIGPVCHHRDWKRFDPVLPDADPPPGSAYTTI
jgi:hypothetical protein